MALREAQSAVAFEGVSLRLKAHVSSWQGKISLKMGDYESAQRAYQEARDLFEQVQDEFEACRAQIDVGQVMIRRGLCRQAESIILAARKEAEDKGFARLHALALGHLVIIAFTNAQLDEAEAYALRSNILARECDFTDLVFRNCVYLWKIAVARGDERLRRLNEKTLRVLLPRVDQELKEAIEFREFLAGGEA
jgi:tetratricopeptide (TPR) repeat protein